MNAQDIRTSLQGKKTYFTAAIGLLYLAGVWLGFWEWDEKVLAAFGLGALAFLRSALSKGTAAVLLALALFATPAQAQTNEPSSALQNGFTYVSQWFRDNTNFWGERTVMVDLAPIYSQGRAEGSAGGKEETWGALLGVRFPLDANGQASIGFFGAYFNEQFFAGSINTTLGKTITLPVVKQPVFLWVEGGPAINLNQPEELLAQAFTGAVWKKDIGKDWSLFVTGGVGRVTGWDGQICIAGLGIGKKF